MFNMGFSELILILLIAFVIVGPKDLPKVARWLGRSVKKLRRLIVKARLELGLDEIEKETDTIRRETAQLQRSADIKAELSGTEKALKDGLREAVKSASDEKA